MFSELVILPWDVIPMAVFHYPLLCPVNVHREIYSTAGMPKWHSNILHGLANVFHVCVVVQYMQRRLNFPSM